MHFAASMTQFASLHSSQLLLSSLSSLSSLANPAISRARATHPGAQLRAGVQAECRSLDSAAPDRRRAEKASVASERIELCTHNAPAKRRHMKLCEYSRESVENGFDRGL